MGNWNEPENDMSGIFEEDTGVKKYFEPKVDRQKPAAPWTTRSPWANQQNSQPEDQDPISVFSSNAKKCPNCGANLTFNPRADGLSCLSCGCVFDPKTLDMMWSMGMSNPEQEYGIDDVLSDEDSSRVEIVCNSCGAQIVTDKNTSSTVCTFCGSPALITRRLTREFHPDNIVPFEIDKNKAMELFKQHCEGIAHLPRDFTSAKTLKKITGIYVPTWLISCTVKAKIVGVGHTEEDYDRAKEEGRAKGRIMMEKASNSGGPVILNDADTFDVSGVVTFKLNDVPFDGEKQIANRIMEAAEPYDYSRMVPFSGAYLQGFYAEKYDQQPKDMNDRIVRRLDRYTLQICEMVDFGFKHFRVVEHDPAPAFKDFTIKYCMLPAWFLHYEYGGRTYQYVINGQTGKVSGEFPYAKGWETMENVGRNARGRAIQVNFELRKLLYALPGALGAFGWFMLRFGARSRSNLPEKMLTLGIKDPILLLLVGLLISAVLYFLIDILPKMLERREKYDRNMYGMDSSHSLASPPGAETYFDTGFAVKYSDVEKKKEGPMLLLRDERDLRHTKTPDFMKKQEFN
ncbi:MAG: TFIIB-type zinc ribbon-containing protein [Saccharofermentans sp.]|nr:TFIIB-type zinc ribbon-containing protein [Saccharofermentans sp.]